MSRNSPPDRAACSGGGGAGSRERIVTISTAPISPARRRRASAEKLGSKRRLKPIMSGCAARRDHLQAFANPARVEVDRLLAEDRLAGPRGTLDQPGMEVGRGADHDGVDVAVLDDRVEVADMRAGRRRKGLRRRRARVRDRREPGPRMRRDIGAVDAPDPPGAEKPNPQHFPRSYFPIPMPYSDNPTGCRAEGVRERLIQVDRQVEL